MNRWIARAGLAGFMSSACLFALAADVTAESYKAAVTPCLKARDLDCAEKNWTYYLRLRPTDSNAIANLGIVLNQRDKHKEAIIQFEKAMDLGEGTYDLFAYYADSLAKVGRTDDAIDWSYKALTVVPRLVDVRGSLAKLLVLQKRHYEALAVLSAYDDEAVATGHDPYFEGQRIAIESSLARQRSAPGTEPKSIRLPKYGDHFYVPVTFGDARPQAFMVDTGAATVALNDALMASAKIDYKVVERNVPIRLADGRKTTGQIVRIASMKVGPFELKDQVAMTCAKCLPLLGQKTLAKFDLKTSKVQGVEFVSLSPR
ncbi:retropepsin-like aspartic protease [Piscinibacter terrae]|uniref:Uncharacterized protein n=1 Tax=Piscinibacter terrae TaxID=2496871 RepID=A0A3N7HS61_9BURK|nr:retropepsin-like aspartic protease [Albitalea terrae]RQP25100.1 hypothetical protein DZC73_09620 [Albitalea terrae]